VLNCLAVPKPGVQNPDWQAFVTNVATKPWLTHGKGGYFYGKITDQKIKS
jgi:DNA-directed RNA polymerase